MRLVLLKTLWGSPGSLEVTIPAALAEGFDGVEGTPTEGCNCSGVFFLAEICTGGSYVPHPGTTMADHLDSLEKGLLAAHDCGAKAATVIGGRDAWSVGESVEFFGQAMALASQAGLPVSFETHRSRTLFHPWVTRDLLRQLPALRLTCDFSHWCCVTERLVLDSEPEVLALCAERASHVHARVGYDQGPQVPHPAAPEYRMELEAHERWWMTLWTAQEAQGREGFTMTPEFGPDGYMQQTPFTGEPVADVSEINRWMGRRLRERFAGRAAVAA
jgi:hypothetical protein